MRDEPKLDESGAYAWKPLIEDVEEKPEKFTNPPGIARGDCDDEAASGDDASCDVEATAQVEDMFLEETKPGIGILGYEGEEDGGS